MFFLMKMFLLLCLLTFPVVNCYCVQNEYCRCRRDGMFYDLYCQMTLPYLEFTGNDTDLKRFYISAGTNHYRLEGKFKNIQVNHVVITGSNVTALDCDLFRGLTGLSSVNIVDTKLSRIPTCTLHKSTNITSLSIINSQINELPRRAFVVLPNLKRIVLRHNCLKHIRLDTFHGVDHLTSLDLSFNCLSGSFTSEPLSHLTKLTYLDISHNNVSSLNVTFHISHNNVSSLNVTFLDYVSASKRSDFHPTGSNLIQAHINFASNRITTITTFQIQVRPSDLEIMVDLSHNDLETMPEISLDEPKQSHVSIYLNISNNHIGRLDRDPVLCNFCLKVTLRMSIAHNILKNFPLCHLHIIEKYDMQLLNISHNFIDGSVNRLCGAEDLRILDLSSNRLTTIGELGFEEKPSRLRELYISGNLISAIEEIDILNVAETLKIVDLRNNSLSDYQQIVDIIPTTLIHIALSENPCNCTFNQMIWKNQRICQSRSLFYGARCAQPRIFRGMQVLCLPGLNCSNLHSCETDSLVELSLNTNVTNEVLFLHWEVIGPGKSKVSEFILTILNMNLNKTHSHLFVHKLSRNYTVAPIASSARYKCCIEAVILNMAKGKHCLLVDTETKYVIDHTSSNVPIVTTIGVTAAIVVISLLVWCVCRRRQRCTKKRPQQKSVIEEMGSLVEDQTAQQNPSKRLDEFRMSEDEIYYEDPAEINPRRVDNQYHHADKQTHILHSGLNMNYLTPLNEEDATDVSTFNSKNGQNDSMGTDRSNNQSSNSNHTNLLSDNLINAVEPDPRGRFHNWVHIICENPSAGEHSGSIGSSNMCSVPGQLSIELEEMYEMYEV